MKRLVLPTDAPPALFNLRSLSLPSRRLLICLSTLAVMISVLGAWWIKHQAQRQLDSARASLDRQALVPFDKETRAAITRKEIKLIQSTKQTKALARFRDAYFAATDGGLIELSLSGEVLRRYSILDGLPESDLISLANYGGQLFIGTSTQGLVAFDGERFTRYRWPDRRPQAVTALLDDQSRLLIGTFAGGLLAFDGQQFKEIKAGAEKQRLGAINCLVKDGARLYVGTFADGLWLAEAGRWLHFTTADGLLSNRITGVVASGERVYAGSDFGISVASANALLPGSGALPEKRFRVLATLPSLSGLVQCRDSLLACTDAGELFQLTENHHAVSREQLKEVEWRRPPDLSSCRLIMLDDALWLLGSEGMWRAAAPAPTTTGRLSLAPFGRIDDRSMPSSNVISALALDAEGRLWAGSFSRGLDLFTPAGQRIAHLESETTREINYLLWDPEAKQMLAATSSGVAKFDAALRSQRLTVADGLLSNAVSHLALASTIRPAKSSAITTAQAHRAIPVFATSRGLSLGEPGHLHGLTTVQGLPSNSLYTVLPFGERLFAGTLSGLAEIEAGRVVRVFKDSNSKLTHNWVTGLCAAGQRVFIGTYGGGVFELTVAGELDSFASEIGRPVVNPNAMFSDGERLYVGTLDGAWALELRSQKWIHLKTELPSPVVLSITGDERQIYFGTTSGIARIEITYLKSIVER